ncbi:fimbrial protein [Burkholderia territorii]|uniref:fimbrial protein n=1 Tax=Burkholderia territorii TaxID=1503055 RepID=UPI0009BEAB08|nr:fimbrial protein [Burkholderia territorii]
MALRTVPNHHSLSAVPPGVSLVAQILRRNDVYRYRFDRIDPEWEFIFTGRNRSSFELVLFSFPDAKITINPSGLMICRGHYAVDKAFQFFWRVAWIYDRLIQRYIGISIKMKIVKRSSAIAFGIGIIAAGSAAASTGGTITFTGAVGDATCSVSGGSGTDGGTNNFIVGLDPASLADVATPGQASHAKKFKVSIGGPGETTCAAGTIATMGFLPSSPRVDAATGNLINALSNGARNVQVQLLDASGTAINLASANTQAVTVPPGATQAELDYSAQYFSTGVGTSGLVSTSVLYNVNYN